MHPGFVFHIFLVSTLPIFNEFFINVIGASLVAFDNLIQHRSEEVDDIGHINDLMHVFLECFWQYNILTIVVDIAWRREVVREHTHFYRARPWQTLGDRNLLYFAEKLDFFWPAWGIGVGMQKLVEVYIILHFDIFGKVFEATSVDQSFYSGFYFSYICLLLRFQFLK